MSATLPPFTVAPQEAGFTLAKVLRSRLGGPSWGEVRKLIAARRVKVGDAICSDEARRLKENEVVVLLEHPKPLPRVAHPERLVVRHLDEHVVVVEKPAGVNTVRHPAELEWSKERRELDPTLEDLTQWAIAKQLDRPAHELPRLRIVHRLDKETSGLVVFARSALAERELGHQFRRHTVVRRYLAVVPGIFTPKTIRSNLVPDRGDGRRGSTQLRDAGKEAVTHVAIEERLPGYTMLSCRLETGRTHQIRIHLSEAGHPVCGDKVYVKKPNGEM
ncbi:MAG TPA: RluA family pseudouridine synthase, partial [Gemmata sp.]|nr:RluA family pseudouridine synthase [Gemmata sp.]